MSTTLAKPAEMVDRKWYVIDAAGNYFFQKATDPKNAAKSSPTYFK